MSPNPLRVLALAPYPESAPSTGFRVTQYLPHLEAAGIRVAFRPFVREDEYGAARGRSRSVTRLRVLARAARRLAHTLGEARGHDVVWIQRGIAPFVDRWALDALLRVNVPVVFDFDDAIYLPQSGGAWWVESLRDPKGTTQRMCQASAVVLAGNAVLAEVARGMLGPEQRDRVRVLPTVVDTERYRPREARPPGPPVVGWVGSDSTVPYFESLGEALRGVVRESGCRVVAVAAQRRPGVPGVDVEFVPWSREADLATFRSLDVGLYPLDDTPWSRGKCGLKALQYLASAVPCVASPVGVLNDIVTPGETGYLASTPPEWIAGILAILGCAQDRDRMGARGRGLVEEAYSVASATPTLAQALRDAADTAARRPHVTVA